MNLLDIIHEVIALARAIPADPALDGAPFKSFNASELRNLEHRPTPQELELRRYLLAQPPAVLRGVEAIMYLGRDYGPPTKDELLHGRCDDFDFLDAYEHLTNVSQGAEADVRHIMGKPLALYLDEGLKRARERGIDVAGLLG